jgi:hypothetical protein
MDNIKPEDFINAIKGIEDAKPEVIKFIDKHFSTQSERKLVLNALEEGLANNDPEFFNQMISIFDYGDTERAHKRDHVPLDKFVGDTGELEIHIYPTPKSKNEINTESLKESLQLMEEIMKGTDEIEGNPSQPINHNTLQKEDSFRGK